MGESESIDDLEPLFDYSRVQPNFVSLDDDYSDSSPALSPKRRKIFNAVDEKGEEDGDVISVNDDDRDEDDWMPPPPKIQYEANPANEDSTRKELRLKRQELAALAAQSAEDILRNVEEAVRREPKTSRKSSSPIRILDEPTKPPCERVKIVISIQDKNELKQFRVYVDDKFDRVFKNYADKAKLDLQKLTFCFDGDKICPTATPKDLGMEDDDIIEVHAKSC
jgi:hypothetical protein